MEYNFLSPNCGLKVSAICLGSMTFKKNDNKFFLSSASIGQEDSYKILDRFVELGGNFVDTANVYMEGQTEEILGEWMKERGNRSEMVVGTKCRFPIGSNMMGDPKKPNAQGLSRKHILEAVEGSLQRMQTDYIDLYQMHMSDLGTPVAETLRTLDDLVRCGKVRYVGACNLAGWQLQKIVDVGDKLGLNPFVTLQSPYSLLGRTSEPDAFTVCKNEGLGLLPWGAVKGGLLTGKFKKGDTKAPEGSRLELASQVKIGFENMPDTSEYLNDESFWTLMDAMERIAHAHGKTPCQVAIRWLLQTPPVTSVIVGTTKLHQLEENMAAVGWRLTQEEMDELNKLTAPKLENPYKTLAVIGQLDGRMKSTSYF